jgi:3-hydroxyisobutyrate dehydrogenase
MNSVPSQPHDLPLQVACIGLGSKGAFIAKKVIASGVSTVLYDLVDTRMSRFTGDNVRQATSFVDALAGATVIITAFANTAEYEDAFMDTDGILKHAAKGAFIIDVTPTTPTLASEVQALGVLNDLRILDGWMASAITTVPGREPSIFLGGDASDLKIADALIQSFRLPVIACAGPGSGKTMGIASLVMHVSSILGVVEALSFAENEGISQADATRFLTALGLHSDLFNAYAEKIVHDDYDGQYSVMRLLSELEVCFEAADRRDLTFPGLENAQQLYQLLSIIGGADKDIAALQLIYGDEATCARHGLDWSRASHLYADGDEHAHHHHKGCGCDGPSDDASPVFAESADDEDDDFFDEEAEQADYDDIIADGFDPFGSTETRLR